MNHQTTEEKTWKYLDCTELHHTALCQPRVQNTIVHYGVQFCTTIGSLDCRVFFPGELIEPVTLAPPPFSDRSIVNLTINCNLFICDRSSKGPIWSSLCLLFPPLGRPWKKSPAYAASPFFYQPFYRVTVRWCTVQKDYMKSKFTAGRFVHLQYYCHGIPELIFDRFCSI